MYYRRKILLALLEALDRPVPETEMQEYLFLVCTAQTKPSYDFVPHKFGCFSFQIEADKRTLTKYGILRECQEWRLASGGKFFHLLKGEDQKQLHEVVRSFGGVRGNQLLKHVYRQYPYFAINSELLDELLTVDEKVAVESARPKATSTKLFTIGYEGKSLERFLCDLIAGCVRVLCDVRRNPVSMKFGFSKNQLNSATNALGIRYVHMPELGIESSRRRGLNGKESYDQLFRHYEKTTLRTEKPSLAKIMDMIKVEGRVALTCFESTHDMCHRGRIAKALVQQGFNSDQIVHI